MLFQVKINKLILVIIVMILIAITSVIYTKWSMLSNLKSCKIEVSVLGAQVYSHYESSLQLKLTKNELSKFLVEADEKHLLNTLRNLSYNLLYDSINDVLYLYSFGLDLDDDLMQRTYKIQGNSFVKLLFVDGDILLAQWSVTDALPRLIDKSIVLDANQNKGDLKLSYKIRNLISCLYYKGEFSFDDDMWMVVENEAENIKIRLYSPKEINQQTEQIEILRSAIYKSHLFNYMKETKIGLYLNSDELIPGINCDN